MRVLVSLLAVAAFAAEARAADLTVSVRAGNGKPVADVVVMAYPTARPAAPPRLAASHRMIQKGMQFDPFMLVVPVGAEVSFPNFDTVRHHVYSFSAARPFELKLYGKDETRSVKFDKAGVIAIGCNIHDQMVAFIRVVDTPYAIKTNAAGLAALTGLPDGTAKIVIWHPYLKAPGREISRTIALPQESKPVFVADLRPAPDVHAY